MRRLRGAVVVSEATRGGSHLSRWVHVHPNFAVSVPLAHHVGATRDWEGTGIKPDITVSREEALRTAHLEALRRLRTDAADESTRHELDDAIAAVSKP